MQDLDRDPEAGPPAIRLLAPSEIDFAARLHAEALPHGFFAALGHRYLKAYYRTFLESPDGVALVAKLRGEPVGFVVGSIDPEAHRRSSIRRHGVRLAWAGIAGLLRQPRLGLDFVGTRLVRYTKGILRVLRPRPARLPDAGDSPAQGRTGVLLHVAVVPSARGLGVGEALVGAFVDCARRAGLRRLELVTLAQEDGATSFYERLGWTRGEILADGDIHYVKFAVDLA